MAEGQMPLKTRVLEIIEELGNGLGRDHRHIWQQAWERVNALEDAESAQLRERVAKLERDNAELVEVVVRLDDMHESGGLDSPVWRYIAGLSPDRPHGVRAPLAWVTKGQGEGGQG
jgi:hypothetical protein